MKQDLTKKVFEITKMTPEQKLLMGRNSLVLLKRGLEEGGISRSNIPNVIKMFTRLLVSADRTCAEEEYQFFLNVTGMQMTRDEFYEMTNGGADKEFIEGAFELIDILDEADRTALVCYAAALLSCDNSFKVSEFSLLDRIMSGGEDEDED